jgi:hypothetical protein
LQNRTTATFTVQLAGAKTAAGNTDVFNASEPYSNLPYAVHVNGHDLDPWIIPYDQSSSCAVRSAVICYVSNQACKKRTTTADSPPTHVEPCTQVRLQLNASNGRRKLVRTKPAIQWHKL